MANGGEYSQMEALSLKFSLRFLQAIARIKIIGNGKSVLPQDGVHDT